jgi:hypothetical protein
MPIFSVPWAARSILPHSRPGVQLDKLALVPASLLPFKRQWQAVANGMPTGSVLLCPTTNPRQQKILKQVSTHMKNKGRHVRTLPAEAFTGRCRCCIGHRRAPGTRF